ncbi:MAG: F0F1 ATP synthase subunit B [Bacteroidota bacterium]
MTLLASIIAPQFGLFFWTTLIFLTFFFVLRRFAWKPIINALNERESSIENSLQEAAKARDEMAKLQADNEALLKEARAERDAMLRDAATMKEEIIKKAKEEAAEAGAKEREKAKMQIEAEKNSALNEIKQTASVLAVEIAEKLLRKEFQDGKAQEAYAKQLVKDLSDN